MNYVNTATHDTGAPLPLASDPTCTDGCRGGVKADVPAAAPAPTAQDQAPGRDADAWCSHGPCLGDDRAAEGADDAPPADCCGDLVCVPIVDAEGRELGVGDWGWWERHMAYQPPRPGQTEVYEENRRRFLALGEYLHRTLPPGPDRTYTLRQLGHVLMCANNTVAAHGVSVRITV